MRNRFADPPLDLRSRSDLRNLECDMSCETELNSPSNEMIIERRKMNLLNKKLGVQLEVNEFCDVPLENFSVRELHQCRTDVTSFATDVGDASDSPAIPRLIFVYHQNDVILL